MVSAAILGIAAMLLAIQLKNIKSELWIYVALAATMRQNLAAGRRWWTS